VLIAENGKQALEILQKKVFQLIFLDCHMPVMDGFTCAETIRKSSTLNKNTPIIAFTADILKSTQQQCFQAGMNDYISKPYKQQQIIGILKKYLPCKQQAAGHPVKSDENLTTGSDVERGIIDDSMLLDFFTQFQAIQIGHINIKNNNIWFFAVIEF